MPIILHHKDPSNITKPDIFTVDTGTNLKEWMLSKWNDDTEMSDGLSVTILLNGKSIFESDAENADESALEIVLGDKDCVSIVNRPAGIEVLIYAVIILVAVAISIALMPALPGNAGEKSDSPNNRMQAAQNAFRPGEAWPEIFGSVVSYPDFIQPSYFEYVNNLKIINEFGCIGEGFYEIGESRNGETEFSSIPGSSFEIFEPGDVIPQELLVIHRSASPVDGQELLAPDDSVFRQSDQIDSMSGGGGSDGVVTLVSNSTAITDMSLEIGGYITLNADDFKVETYQIIDIQLVVDKYVITINDLDPYFLIAGVWPQTDIISTDADGQVNNYVGWFDIPGDNAEEIWFNWQMPQGIRSEDGKQISIDIEFEIETLDSADLPTGLKFFKPVTISGNTLNPQFRTTKFTPDEFPSMQRTKYRGRVQRTSNKITGAASQQIKMEQFVSVTPYTNLDNSSRTMIAWKRRATTFAIASSGNKNNLDVTRKLPTYNRVTDFYDVNDLQPTRSFADAAAYTLIVASGRSADTVDLAELYGIFDGLPYPELGYFDFTFDNKDVGLGERIQSICNVARVSPFRDGAIWRFVRDEIKPIRTAMFNRRVTIGNSSSQAWLLQRPDDKDSVALTYVDPDKNVEKVLYRRIDSLGNILEDGAGRQPLEIKLAGCRGFFQAWDRANLEIRRIAYQRRTVKDKVMRDGLMVGLMERVGWIDPNDVSMFSGEVLGFSGDVYDTSERFTPDDGESYLVYITDDEGNVSNTVTATARLDTEFGFIATGLSGAYLASSSGDQLGSKYFIGTADNLIATDFMVTSRKPNEDGSVNIELVEYVEDMYELDSANPPQQPVTLPINFNAIAATSIPDDAVATITVGADGAVTASGGFVWDYVGTPSAGIGVNFEARLTQESGDAIAGDLVGEWIQVSSDLEWTLTKDGAANGVVAATATLEIRDRTFKENIGTSSATISAIVGGVVSLPASMTISTTQVGTSARAELQVLSNGTYKEIDNITVTGNYVSPAVGIGANYEARATLVSGLTPDGNPLDVWINLGGSAVRWYVTAPAGFNVRESVIDVEIRSVVDPLNTDTSQVLLRATTEL